MSPAGIPDRIATRVGGADGTTRIHPLRRARRRLGHRGLGRDGRQAPEGLLGIHVNFAQMVPLDILGHIRNGDPAPAGLSDAEKRAYEQVAFATYHRGYGVIQGTRPQTIGYSLADTPVGLAAWLLDHDTITDEHLAQLFAGQPYGAITRRRA